MKEDWKEEIRRVTAGTVDGSRSMTFAVLADSHLDDWEEETIAHMRAVDETVSYDFVVHLGDFMTGNLPRGWTARLLGERTRAYLGASEKGVFYPVQGNHDGYCEPTSEGIRCDMVVDEDWYEATDFTERYTNVVRKKNRPYYYADYAEQKLRLIFLCSFSYEWTGEGTYRKRYEMSREQLVWLKEEALAREKGWTVMLFSHDGPLQLYDQERLEEEPWSGSARQLFDTVLEARAAGGFDIAGWFIGHWHGDLCRMVEGIPFIIIGSQTYYVPQLWPMPDTGGYASRELAGVTRDLWDSVAWDKDSRTLRLIRFGAGWDRIVNY